MSTNENNPVPYIVHEGVMARNERTVKRLTVALVLAIVLMFVSNALWLYAWTQYDYSGSDTTKFVDINSEDGTANYIGNDGDINNGANKSSYNNEKKNANTQEKEW